MTHLRENYLETETDNGPQIVMGIVFLILGIFIIGLVIGIAWGLVELLRWIHPFS
jgi:hypothetical protein